MKLLLRFFGPTHLLIRLHFNIETKKPLHLPLRELAQSKRMDHFLPPVLMPCTVSILLLVSSAGLIAEEVRDDSISKAIAKLGSNRFSDRTIAMTQLRKLGMEGFPELSHATANNNDNEISARCWSLINDLKSKATPEQLVRMQQHLQKLAHENKQMARRVERFIRPPVSDRKAKAIWAQPIVVQPVQLTPAQKARLAKQRSFDKVIRRIDQQIRRMKETSEAAPNADRAKYAKAIENLKSQRKRIQDIKENVK